MAKYPKAIMTLKELKEVMGFSEEYLRTIARDRKLNKEYGIACKQNPKKKNSPYMFDTEALDKYRKAHCTGE